METAFLSTSDLATRWGLTYNAIYKWRLKGYGPKFHKVGNRVVYQLDDVEQFENSRRCRSTSEYSLKAVEEASALKKRSLSQVIPLSAIGANS